MKDTYPAGMAFVVWGITVIVLAMSVYQAVCEKNGWPSLSYQIGHWSSKNPLLASVYILVVFFLLGHFVLNPLHPQ